MNFLEKIAQYILNEQTSSALPSIAMQGLEEGYETPSLIMLAGCNDNENPFLINQYFQGLLHELSLNSLDKKQAALFLVNSTVDKIVSNQIDVYEGCDFIFKQILDLTDLRSENKKFVYDSIELADVYSLYVTIWELMHASVNWDKIKTNNNLMEETKQEIKKRLLEWKMYIPHDAYPSIPGDVYPPVPDEAFPL